MDDQLQTHLNFALLALLCKQDIKISFTQQIFIEPSLSTQCSLLFEFL